MHPLLIAGIVLFGIPILLFAIAGFETVTRGTPISNVRSLDDSRPPVVSTPEFCHLVQLSCGTAMNPGNTIEILAHGDETYPRLWADLRSARRTITLQMYYFRPGRMAEELKEILMERARAGVTILVLRDAFGGKDLSRQYIRDLVEAGVEVCDFRPTHWYELHKVQNRSHIRIAIIDGCTAYTGGFGIDDQWWGDGRTKESWRDTNVRFTGPAVAQHQATFVAGWAEAAQDLLIGSAIFPTEAFEPTGAAIAAAVMHAKAAVVDGLWSVVGTMNFDNRSFALNDESVVIAYDRHVALRLESLFIADLAQSHEITLDEWRRRPLRKRVYERGATLMSRLL